MFVFGSVVRLLRPLAAAAVISFALAVPGHGTHRDGAAAGVDGLA